ncbi:PadR family transcriptional regulator [Pseudomonas juntendi]|uniref:PadR family transcriptional regulator n=1 Tax=Pseudomonas putida TaxID=303 RepID=A0A1X0ZXZ1_PSEPU|nr:PadR family transcriptional regulator [Pseudomonas putida]MEB3902108.1 PadR family transcriptional regulator [Pseudomonas putida]ORL64769.1 PadR family transcriptional regulator [Pseudomonas putida]
MRDHDPFERRPSRGERGPRVFAPGDLRLLMLSMLAEQPGHGYDLIRQIESLFDGSYTPSPGVIYPTLNYLEEAELITGHVQGSKRLYAITEAGRRALADQAVALDGVRMRIEVSKRALRGHDRPPEIHEAVGNLRHALHMHSGHWSNEEIERVRKLLNDTAKAIASGPDEPVMENTP